MIDGINQLPAPVFFYQKDIIKDNRLPSKSQQYIPWRSRI